MNDHAHARPSRRRFAASATTTLLALATLTALAVVPAPAMAAPPAADRFLKVYAPENESFAGARSLEQALADAENYDMITARLNSYKGHVAAMTAANPDLVIIAYLNGTFAQKTEGTKYPESWYARDAYGRKVTSKGYGNYLMDPRNPEWIQNRTAFCNTLMQSTGYGGCMLDMLGTAPTMPSYVSSPPVDPRTDALWTAVDWQAATTALAAQVDGGTNGALWGNGYGSASRYFGSSVGGTSKVLSDGVHGALSEIWIRTAHQSITSYPTELQWNKNVNQLVDLGLNGERTAAMVKMWSTGTTAQKDAFHRFALATFLLGSDGTSSFHASYTEGQVLLDHPYWKTDIGQPTSGYALTDGVYQRSFSTGRVLVNPTTISRTIDLGATYVGLDGVSRTTITMAPSTGEVMRLP
jgi:hypothetical protein